jgi:general stress protein 26
MDVLSKGIGEKSIQLITPVITDILTQQAGADAQFNLFHCSFPFHYITITELSFNKILNGRDRMLEKMKGLVKGNDLCVLATVSEGKPHCSLMSYISDEEGREIYLISHKKTKKYNNLMQNPTVSLLIDSREEEKGQRRIYIKALTVSGEFQTINDPVKKGLIREKFLKRHPHLIDFLNDPGAEIFSIKIKSFQLLDGVKDAFFETID